MFRQRKLDVDILTGPILEPFDLLYRFQDKAPISDSNIELESKTMSARIQPICESGLPSQIRWQS